MAGEQDSHSASGLTLKEGNLTIHISVDCQTPPLSSLPFFRIWNTFVLIFLSLSLFLPVFFSWFPNLMNLRWLHTPFSHQDLFQTMSPGSRLGTWMLEKEMSSKINQTWTGTLPKICAWGLALLEKALSPKKKTDINRHSPKHLLVGISSTTGEATVPPKTPNINRYSPENLCVGISSTGEGIISQKNPNMNRYSPKHSRVGISSTGEAFVSQKNPNMNRHSPKQFRVETCSTEKSPPKKKKNLLPYIQ